MLQRVIKRGGSETALEPQKLNNWGVWAASNLQGLVDWQSVVMDVVAELPEVVKTSELQEALIDKCLQKKTWGHQRMAGRLYMSTYYKDLYGKGKLPSIQSIHKRMIEAGLLVSMDYSDADYEHINTLLKHERDFNYPYFQLKQIRNKYALKNRLAKKEYETPQLVFMRMAMALAEDQPKERRLHDIKMWYNHFSLCRISAPTPNYVNLGTKLRGFASCCLIRADDQAKSLAALDHIAYMMTVSSAGIGAMVDTRSVGDPVRSGQILHAGIHLPL